MARTNASKFTKKNQKISKKSENFDALVRAISPVTFLIIL
jgi:hypothetical protein